MRSTIFLSAIILALFTFWGCDDNDDINQDNGIDREQSVEEKSATDINPDDYEIIFRDSYGDYFYLNPISNLNSTVPANYYAYDGSFVSAGVSYNTAVIYYKNTKTLAASLFYYNGQCMVYNAQWVSNNYFKGSYAWVKATYDYQYKQRYISCTFTKGAFPGMNDTSKSATTSIPGDEYPGSRDLGY